MRSNSVSLCELPVSVVRDHATFRIIAALTREHGGWEQARLRTSDERSRVQCLVPARGARRGKALDEVGAAIPRDAVARNNRLQRTVMDNVPRHVGQRAAAEPER